MIDTLNIEINRELVTSNVIDQLIGNLNNPELCKGKDYTKCRGKIRNYLVEVSETHIKLKGSLCKFYHGNNLSFLTRSEIKTALRQLSFETGLPIEKGRIMRIDAGINLNLSQSPLIYLESLNETPKFVRNQRGSKATGVYYDKANYSLSFYDKMKELQKRDPVTYERNKGKNVLRMELSLKQRVKATLKYSKGLKVVLLHSSTFHEKLNDMMVKCYENIVKKAEMHWEHLDGLPELKKAITYFGVVHMGGLAECIKAIDKLRKEECWSENKIKGIKDWIKGICQTGNSKFLTNTEFVEELNKRVYEWLHPKF